MSTVVMAVDGTAKPLTILPLYRSMVREPDRVVLVYVRNPLSDAKRASAHPEASGERAERVLRTIRQALENSGPVSVTTLVREGARADEILKVADEERADLIIIGFARTTGLLRLLTGCDVGDVERRAAVPVIVARRSIGTTAAPHIWNRREPYAA
jgi:nucleotide-binding universal stress UspA family protein